MLFNAAATLSLAIVTLASPLVVLKSEPPADAIFIPCAEDSQDPICHLVKQPSQDVITEITHPNGTTEVKKNLYTRAQLQAIREENKVVSKEHAPHQESFDGSAAFINSITKRESTKRESAPPICWTQTQKWYDTHDWGYWYQSWHQVGNCFYCDQCIEAINTSFGVSQTWTWGISAKFGDVITSTFGFSWGQTFSLSDTRTCQWNFVESGCHSIWY